MLDGMRANVLGSARQRTEVLDKKKKQERKLKGKREKETKKKEEEEVKKGIEARRTIGIRNSAAW